MKTGRKKWLGFQGSGFRESRSVTEPRRAAASRRGVGTPVFVLQNGFISHRALDRSPLIVSVATRTMLQNSRSFCSIAPVLPPRRWFGTKVSRQCSPGRRPAARIATKRREASQQGTGALVCFVVPLCGLIFQSPGPRPNLYLFIRALYGMRWLDSTTIFGRGDALLILANWR